MDSSILILWTGSFPYKEYLVDFYCFTSMPLLNANSVDLDQTPRYVASDLGTHSLPMSNGTLGKNRLRVLNIFFFLFQRFDLPCCRPILCT